MSNKSPLFTEILATVGTVTFSPENAVSVEGFDLDSIIKERAGVTDEQLGGIRDTLEATSAALTHKVGNSFIERFKEDASINHLDFETTGALASLGVHIARPTDGKTVSDYRAGIGSRVTIRGLDSVSDVADELAVMWADL